MNKEPEDKSYKKFGVILFLCIIKISEVFTFLRNNRKLEI